jgi:hypothetical protein
MAQGAYEVKANGLQSARRTLVARGERTGRKREERRGDSPDEMRDRTARERRKRERSCSLRWGLFWGAGSSSIYEVYSLLGMAPFIPCKTKQPKE